MTIVTLEAEQIRADISNLEMDLEMECENCDGTGEVIVDGEQGSCPPCDGTGMVEDDSIVEELEEARDALEELSMGHPREDFTAIREDSFTEYAQELAEDVGTIEDINQWPATHIDWSAAADDLLSDYISADYDGHTWFVR